MEANECLEGIVDGYKDYNAAVLFPVVYLFEAFFPEPSTSCLRPSMPSCSTVWALGGSTGMVAALSGSFGIITETEGSSSREPLSLISDTMGTVESPAVPSSRPEVDSIAPEPDWSWKKVKTETERGRRSKDLLNIGEQSAKSQTYSVLDGGSSLK